jgi:uridine kinase
VPGHTQGSSDHAWTRRTRSPLRSRPRAAGLGDKASCPVGRGRYGRLVTVVRLADVLADIMQGEPVGAGIRIVGVDGPSGSGKSTLASRLSLLSRAPIVEVDDFGSWPVFAQWWPRFDDQVIHPLLSGADARYQVRDWANDEFGTSLNGWKTVPWTSLVIIEGVTCTRQDASLSYRIWVEAPGDLRLERGIARDGESHRDLWLDWRRREREFFDADATKARADLRVDGNPSEIHDAASEIVLLSR